MIKKNSLTIIIPALNEANNIKSLCQSLISQNSKYYVLKNIIVASDGSTDDTVAKAREIKSKKIEVLDFKKRMGKSYRLESIYKKVGSSLTLILDADLKISNPNVIDSMVYPFVKSNDVYMTGGNSVPLVGNNFISNSINCTTRPYIRMKDYVNSLTIGPILAFRTKFISSIKFPKDLYGEDIFSYLYCLYLGHKYVYCKKAVVYYKTPSSLSEHISQNTKFLASPIKMKSYFPPTLLDKENEIPLLKLASFMIEEFLRYPLHCTFIFVVNLYCQFLALLKSNKIDSRWMVVSSTK